MDTLETPILTPGEPRRWNKLNMRVDRRIWDRLDAEADRRGVSKNALIRHLLVEGLDRCVPSEAAS